MNLSPKYRNVQVLADWISPENLLTPDEIIIERSFHRLLVSLAQPKPSDLMLAFVSVLAIPVTPANRGPGKC